MNSSLVHDTSFVNGEWYSGSIGTFEVDNPFDGNPVFQVKDAGNAAVEEAISAAHAALKPWQAKTAKERSAILEKWHDLILEHKQDLAEIMTLECGKPITESLGEVRYGTSFIKWFAEEGKRAYGDVIPSPFSDRRMVALKQPVGVAAALTPWNFPLAMITRKVAPALAVGCTVVARPSEVTPVTALALADLANKAGFPPGVFNVVVGYQADEMGKVLCQSEKVRKISFTGSTRVGHILMEQCAPTLKKLSLELGGNAPFIVFEDADVDKAVEGAVAAKFRNSGQTCVCANRFLVHERIHEEFVQKFVQSVKGLQMGNGLNDTTQIGPLIRTKAVRQMEILVEDAILHGGEVKCGGRAEGHGFYQPTVVTKANSMMKLAKEEIFGPIAPIFSFRNDDEALALANDTKYGLAAYFYAKDVNRCWRMAEALQYGMVGINTGLISSEVAPFGGIKQSGFGREGSKYGIEDYLELKYMCYGNLDS